MKLAEALQERADLNVKIEQLRSRLNNNVLHQQGEKPVEDPKELKKELDSSLKRLEYLIAKINLSNSTYKVDKMTLTEMIARKDALSLKLSIYKDLVYTAGTGTSRARATEIKVLPSISVTSLQKEVDSISKELRLLDNKLQENNWKYDLIEK